MASGGAERVARLEPMTREGFSDVSKYKTLTERASLFATLPLGNKAGVSYQSTLYILILEV